MFQEAATLQRTTPSKTSGVEIELPDFDEMFGRIQAVSPLARLAISGKGSGVGGGFAAIDDSGKGLCLIQHITLMHITVISPFL
jgi:hypothetical protein